MTTECLKQTPLHGLHTAAGGRMAPFGGWDMPIQYPTGILREVAAVRRNAGMFDVSHMGRIEFSGSAATAFLDSLLSATSPNFGEAGPGTTSSAMRPAVSSTTLSCTTSARTATCW